MKKLALLLVAIGAISTGYSQKLKDAKKSFKEAQSFLSIQNEGEAVKNITAAKDVIDALVNDPKNANDAEIWYYKAAIYTFMQEIPQFQSKSPYVEGAVALEKALSINKKKTLGIEGAQNLVLNNGFYSFNDGISSMNSNKFTDAASKFEVAYNLLNVDNGATFKDMKQVDTIKARALYFNGLSAYYGENYNGAVKSLDLAMANPIVASESSLYLNLANSYGKLNQRDKQLQIIEKGKKLFPNEGNLVAAEINYFIDAGEADKVIGKLENEIKANPEKHEYYYNLGLTYLQIVEKNKDNSKELDHLTKALSNFEKAQKLQSSNIDYAYGVGTTAFNIAATFNNKMVDEKNSKELVRLSDERDKYFQTAAGSFKQVNEYYKSKKGADLTQTDTNKWNHAIKALSNIYANLNMTKEYDEIQKQIK